MKTENANRSRTSAHKHEERISLHAFESARALKTEIRKVVTCRNKTHFKIDHMFSRGPYIYLVFKKEVRNEVV